MSIETFAPVSGGTTATTGGSSDPFESAGSDLGQHRLISSSDSMLLQRKIDFSVSPPKPSLNAPNGYTQGRRKMYFTFPVTLANGKTTVESVTVVFATDIETDASRMNTLRALVGQAIHSSALDGFYNNLSAA
jgi:hypothetical protein